MVVTSCTEPVSSCEAFPFTNRERGARTLCCVVNLKNTRGLLLAKKNHRPLCLKRKKQRRESVFHIPVRENHVDIFSTFDLWGTRS